MKKLLWHSNAPFAPTGYGQQTAVFAPFLAEDYELAVSSFYGLEGAPIKWNGIPIFPGLGGEYGSAVLPEHALRYFDGDLRSGIVITLMDVWVLDPAPLQSLNLACWCPVDHDPAPPKVKEFLALSEAVPVAMSRFGEQMLEGLHPLYVPHGIDTSVYKPQDQVRARRKSFPEGAYVVGIVAANKGRPSRKGFAQAMRAYADFARERENVYLYLHTQLDPQIGQGENLPALIRDLGIPESRVRVADQYALMHRPYSNEDMARVYASIDVLLNPSLGEGFGLTVLEAQACGVPCIVTDFSAMKEVCGAGWHVKHQPFWTGLGSWQAVPDIPDIISALVESYELTPARRERLAKAARRHAMQYDAQRVYKQHWRPALREIERRFEARRPIVVPSRLKAAA